MARGRHQQQSGNGQAAPTGPGQPSCQGVQKSEFLLTVDKHERILHKNKPRVNYHNLLVAYLDIRFIFIGYQEFFARKTNEPVPA